MKKQQTAIDIAFEKLANQGLLITRDYKNLVAYREAKEMEKQQKRKDFTDGYMHGSEPLNHDVIDKWYNETYGGNK